MKNKIRSVIFLIFLGIFLAWLGSSRPTHQANPLIPSSKAVVSAKPTPPEIKGNSQKPNQVLSPESHELNEQWKTTVSEVDVDNYRKANTTYQMKMSIRERVLPKNDIARLKLTPNNSQELKAVQQVAGITDKNISLAVHHSYPAERSGLVTTRLQVFNQGIPVIGSELIVNQIPTKQGLKEQVVNYQIKNASSELATNPKLPADKAFEIAADHAVQSSNLDDLETQMESSRLVYFPGPEKMHLAWNVVVKTPPYPKDKGTENPGRWDYMVDAETGEVVDRANLIQTEAATFQASGDGGNTAFPRPWVNELDVTLNSSTGLYETNTSRLTTFDLKLAVRYGFYVVDNSSRPYLVTGNSLTGFGNAAANNAHGFARNTLDMLSYFGYNSIDEKGYVIKSAVNPKNFYANAYWDGATMLYAPEDSYYYAFSSDLGVVAHEIGHGFTQKHSNLRYSRESGGLNESFSDIAGVTAKFFMNQSGANFLIGERLIKPNLLTQKPDGSWVPYTFFRDMCNPTADGWSIDNWSNYNNSLNVHNSSGIMNKVFCRFANRLTSGSTTGSPSRDAVLKAAKVFYQANKTQWGQLSTFKSAAIGTMQTATDLNYTASDIQFLKDSWNDAGIDSTLKYVTITVLNMDKANIVNPATAQGDTSLKFTCNSPQTQCSVTVAAGYNAEFRIWALPNYRTTGISGCDSLLNNIRCTVRADTDLTVTPNFVPTFIFYPVSPQNGTVRFTVDGTQYVRGSGQGNVWPDSFNIPQNTIVSVTATPDAGFYLQRFSSGGGNTGCDSVSGSVCTVTMVANKTVVTEFARTVCTPSLVGSQACTVTNGSGTQSGTCNSNGSAWGNSAACTVTSCNVGYMNMGGNCSIPGPSDPAQLEPGRTAGPNPRGYFDGRTASGNFGGWVCQTNLRNSLKIRVYVGSPTATKAQQTFVGEYITNQLENAAVSNSCSDNANPYLGSRRFSIPRTDFGTGYSGKTVFVYGVKFGTTQEFLLNFGGLYGYTNKLP